MKKLLLLLTCILSGCLVGPNYRRPATYLPDTFIEDDSNENAYLDDSDFCQWWRGWNDPILNDLLAITMEESFDYRIALEMMWQARANYLIAAADLLPEVNFDAFATRARSSRNLAGSVATLGKKFQNFFLVGFDFVWQLDIFGGLERARRAALFSAEAEADNTRGVQITVLSEVAMNYVAIRTLQTKLSLQREIIDADRNDLSLLQDRFQAGLASDLVVGAARRQLDTDLALFNSMEILLKEGIYGLASIVGLLPEQLSEKLEPFGPIPLAGGKIPVELPSELLRRRPDIRSAERNLASATEEIGVAVAQLFPQFSLASSNLFGSRFQSSNYGYVSNRLSNLLTNPSKTWSFGLSLFEPLIDFGRRIEAIHLQKSVAREALLTYEKTVVTAVAEVESALVAYKEDEKSLYEIEDKVSSAINSYGLVKDLFQAGLASYEEVLISRKTLLAAQTDWAITAQDLSTDLIALYKALGGEWECECSVPL